jgi:hypothetical protein
MDHIRIWTEVDIKELQEHVIIVDDRFGFCPGCRELGIRIDDLKKCPKCGREFKYVTSRESAQGGGKGFEVIMRIKKKMPHLTFIDYGDYERVTGRKKAESLFKGI